MGFTTISAGFVLLSSMTGPLWQFLAINFVFTLLDVLTSSMVLARAIVDHFDQSRGLALSLMMSVSPVSGAMIVPLIDRAISAWGWRGGYLVLAAICAAGGVITVLLIGRKRADQEPTADRVRPSRAELKAIAANPAFLVLMAGMLLVNVPQAFASTQLKPIALDLGVADASATRMLSLYGVGVIAGRLICGLALDRLGTRIVALIIGLPALAYTAFALPGMGAAILTVAVLFVGMAQGAEGDIGAFVISRTFDHRNFSLIYAVMNMMVGLGFGLGSLAVSAMLARDLGYRPFPFVVLCAITALTGAVLFSLTRRFRRVPPSHGDRRDQH